MELLNGRFFLLIAFVVNTLGNDETRLHDDLLSNGYNPEVRPVDVFREPLPVFFEFILEEVQCLNVKAQYLDVSAFVTLAWNDPSLAWDKFSYSGVDETLINTEFVWKPDFLCTTGTTCTKIPCIMLVTPKFW